MAGLRALLPMGGSIRVGVDAGESDPPDKARLKEVLWPLERKPLLDEPYMDMVRELSLRQMSPEGKILETLLPARLRDG